MKALNLYLLTRIRDSQEFSRLERALSGRAWHRDFSAHEVESLCELVDGLAEFFSEEAGFSEDNAVSGHPDRESGEGRAPGRDDWVGFFDGFYFSFTIEHISKEFDLLKLSEDGTCALNIELKSESIEEERIRKQLEQNRYYLSHIARTILSYTYVMETDELYCLNDHGYLGKCGMAELAQALRRPALQQFAGQEIGQYFRAQDYLISPVRNPEKLLTGRYFLTNQQAEFRRRILEILRGEAEEGAASRKESPVTAAGAGLPTAPAAPTGEADAGDPASPEIPVISLTGSAGTGKTLLLFDLAIELSKKKKVLFLHGGPLREGHRVIDSRLHKVTIRSGTEDCREHEKQDPPEVRQDIPEAGDRGEKAARAASEADGYSFILVDEANRFPSAVLENLFTEIKTRGIPAVFSYDPHSILGQIPLMEEAEGVLAAHESHRLELSGNIRINRPIYSFLRTLFHQKDRGGHVDYECIDILYAEDRREEEILTAHYLAQGYELIHTSREAASLREGDYISQEYDRVLMILDSRFYYDESLHLCADRKNSAAIPLLYEGLSRARERLCLLVVGNRTLFSQILSIRES